MLVCDATETVRAGVFGMAVIYVMIVRDEIWKTHGQNRIFRKINDWARPRIIADIAQYTRISTAHLLRTRSDDVLFSSHFRHFCVAASQSYCV